MNKNGDRFEVMFFLPHLGGGGAEMNAVRLAPGLMEAGITPVYALTRGPGGYAELLPPGAETVVLDTGRIDSSTLRVARARRPLARLIETRRPDVLCPVMPLPAVAALSTIGTARHRPAVVLSVQNSLSVTHERNQGLWQRIEMSLIRKFFPRADGVIALSEGVAQEVRRIVPEVADRVVMVHNIGLPLPHETTAALALPRPLPGRTCTIIACGRLTEQKDYPTLLRAFAQVARDGHRLDILGEGGLRAPLSDLARQLGIGAQVRFLGFKRDPFSHMRQADVFVLSSQWEGFGNVVVEAMAMGAPVVATDCPHGPAEIVSHGETGLLVPVGDVDALASALRRLIEDPASRTRLGLAGQMRAQDFSAGRIASEYARHFRSFAKNGRGSDHRARDPSELRGRSEHGALS